MALDKDDLGILNYLQGQANRREINNLIEGKEPFLSVGLGALDICHHLHSGQRDRLEGVVLSSHFLLPNFFRFAFVSWDGSIRVI